MTQREEDKAAAAEGEADAGGRKSAERGRRKSAVVPEKHLGKLFVATPDGNAFAFNLEGVALPPKEPRRISEEVQCKTSHTQAVGVTNWLQDSQRFNVKLSLLEPASATEEIKIHGVDTFDLPGGVTKDYKFSVYAYREGSALARVLFTNVRTEEFLAVDVAFKFIAPETVGEVKFNTVCRTKAVHPITVLNPLPSVAAFKCEA